MHLLLTWAIRLFHRLLVPRSVHRSHRYMGR